MRRVRLHQALIIHVYSFTEEQFPIQLQMPITEDIVGHSHAKKPGLTAQRLRCVRRTGYCVRYDEPCHGGGSPFNAKPFRLAGFPQR